MCMSLDQALTIVSFGSYDDVDVVVSSLQDVEANLRLLKIEKKEIEDPAKSLFIVNLKWLTDSNKHGRVGDKRSKSFLIAKLVNGKLSSQADQESPPTSSLRSHSHVKLEDLELPDYECQRATPLHHFNEELTVSSWPLLQCPVLRGLSESSLSTFKRALEVLEENATFKGTEVDDVRALSFRRSICVLKCLPSRVRFAKQIKHLKHIGQHTYKVIDVS